MTLPSFGSVMPKVGIKDITVKDGSMTAVTLSNGRKLEGIVGGSVRGNGPHALVFLTIQCQPTINGQHPDVAFTQVLDANGKQIVHAPTVEAQPQPPPPVIQTHAWSNAETVMCGSRDHGTGLNWDNRKVTCDACVALLVKESATSGRPLVR